MLPSSEYQDYCNLVQQGNYIGNYKHVTALVTLKVNWVMLQWSMSHPVIITVTNASLKIKEGDIIILLASSQGYSRFLV